MILLTRLQEYGADISGAMTRFMNDESLYEACFADLLHDPCFMELSRALEAGEHEAAFDAAHTLKGVTGNMGLTPLYRAISELVESLRAKDFSQLKTMYAEVERQYEVLKQLKY